ncbi:MAG: hypothetical protein GXP63_02205 [DPANN group archaeon]|nr:hypothetical protein [DPANN group archaeon]
MDKGFLIDDQDLKGLAKAFSDATKLIHTAINERRPVWIRHHGDCDGYAAGVALQSAIIPLMVQETGDRSAGYKRCRRAPSRTPWYDIEDATKDIMYHLEDRERFGNPPPLLIVMDNGSTEEDVPALEKVKVLGFQVLVVDHHDPGENKADKFIDVHINPHQVNPSSEITAGMLGVELARWVKEDFIVPHMAAVAGIADRSRGKAYEQYLRLAEEEGFDGPYLEKLSLAIDHEAYLVRYSEGRQYFNLLFGARDDRQERLVMLIAKAAQEKKEQLFQDAKAHVKIEDREGFILAKIPLQGMTNRGTYPTIGKIAGMVRDWLETERKKTVIALSIDAGRVSFRMSHDAAFDVNKIKTVLQEKLPHANVTGGGHAHAGTIRFHAMAQDEILKNIDEQLT